MGAPRGTYPGGLDLPELNPVTRGGLVYQCPIRAGNCSGLGANGSGDDRRLFDGERKYGRIQEMPLNQSVMYSNVLYIAHILLTFLTC